MGSTYHSIHFHLVFSTKDRVPVIRSEWRSGLHGYLGGTIRGLGGVAEAVGGVADHVHLLVGLTTTIAPAAFVRELKKASSVWAADSHEPRFGWQEGYGIFSISASHCEAVGRYITNQEEHHRTIGFREELERLLERNGVAYDPQYLP